MKNTKGINLLKDLYDAQGNKINPKSIAEAISIGDNKTLADFFNQGGTIGGELTSKAPIKVEKDWSGFEMWNTSKSDFIRLVPDPSNMNLQIQSMRNGEPKANVVIAKNSIYPFGDNPSTLGVDVAPWKDVFLSGLNKTLNGYTKLPNGIILQWGEVTINTPVNLGYYDIYYASTFPNAVLTIVPTLASLNNWNPQLCGVDISDRKTNKFTVRISLSGVAEHITFRFFAIGY